MCEFSYVNYENNYVQKYAVLSSVGKTREWQIRSQKENKK